LNGLSRGLEKNGQIQELNLAKNKFTKEGITNLSNAISANH